MFNQLLNTSNYFLNPYAIPVMLVGLLILSIGFFVLRQNRKSIVNITFFYECFSTGFWLFTISFVYLSRNPNVAILWYRYFTFFGVANIMPSLLLFVAMWLGYFKRHKFFFIGNLIMAFVFYGVAVGTDKLISPYMIRGYFWGFYPIYVFGPWSAAFLMVFSIQSAIGFAMLHSAYKSERVSVERLQIGTITIATLIGLTASADFLPKLFNLSLYPYGYISMFIYIVLLAYSIVRYRAFDIETVVHKTAMWLFSFSFIIAPLLLIYKWVSPLLLGSVMLQIVFWVISSLLLAVYLRVIQPKIDHFFQRRQSDLEEISSKFTEDLVHLKGLNQLIQRIEDTIADTLYPQRIDIFIYNAERKVYKLANVVNKSQKITALNGDDRFLQWLAKNNKITYWGFVNIDPAYAAVKENARDYFELTDAMVAIPLVLNEKLLGIINLSKKASLRRYGAADFHFLNMLKNQSTIAISNSLLYENIEEQVRQRTKELIEVQKQLVQAEKLATVGTLAGGVAHEINNPLTAVLTNVQMLLVDTAKLDIDAKESLQLIEEATQRCRTIVQKLMTYAKKPLEATTVAEINLLEVVKKVAAFLEYQLLQDNIKVIIQAKEKEYPVRANFNEIEQVVTNLLLNARDAIKQVKKNGEIEISLRKAADDGVKLEVKDNGAGIPREIMPKIFDPFFTTKDVGKGTGLGLSICHSIVEKYNGMITAQSEPNKGSIFTVQLPKAKEGTAKAGTVPDDRYAQEYLGD